MLSKGQVGLFSTAALSAFVFLLNLLVGWVVWITSQDEFSTVLAVLIVTISFFFSPVVKKRTG